MIMASLSGFGLNIHFLTFKSAWSVNIEVPDMVEVDTTLPPSSSLTRTTTVATRAVPEMVYPRGTGAEAHLGCHPNASLKACSSTVGGYGNYGTAIRIAIGHC